MSYRWRAGALVVYSPATIHEAMSPCVSPARTDQSACSPTGAPRERYAVLWATLSDEKSCCGVSKEPLVSRLTWPEKGVVAKKFDARRADEFVTRPRTLSPPNGLASGPLARATMSCGTVASFRTVRRAWR